MYQINTQINSLNMRANQMGNYTNAAQQLQQVYTQQFQQYQQYQQKLVQMHNLVKQKQCKNKHKIIIKY